MRAAVDPRYKRGCWVMGSQMGKTSSIFNIAGHRLDDNPAPVLYVGSSQNNVRTMEPKIMAMLRLAPSLKDKLDDDRRSSKMSKSISGVTLRLAWAGSATELASDSAAIVFVDEYDKTPENEEGDVLEQAEARTSTYADGMVIASSTPTEGAVETYEHPKTGIHHWKVGSTDAIRSPIWQLWQTGTRHEWAVPCQFCQEYFVPRIKQLKWHGEGSVTQRARTARLVCPRCGGLHEDRHKLAMNANGRYLAPGEYVENGEVCGEAESGDSDTFSCWASGLMAFSPKKTLEFMARKLIRAYHSGNAKKIQGVLNTDFGELFAEQGEAPKSTTVSQCRGSYLHGEYPQGIVLLTSFVDVQKSRLIYTIRGWGAGLVSWLVDYGELFGETDQPKVWAALQEVLLANYGGGMIRLMGIDSGYRPDPVYQFCTKHPAIAVPTKGHDQLNKPYYSAPIEVNRMGRPQKLGIQLWHMDSDVAKAWVHSRINADERNWFVPQNVSEDYCAQLVNEQRTVKANGRVSWVKRGENHYLDCEAGAYMAMRMLNQEPALLRMVNGKSMPQAPGRRVRSPGVRLPG
jgi:phage terminase large subunit GpA-like protein